MILLVFVKSDHELEESKNKLERIRSADNIVIRHQNLFPVTFQIILFAFPQSTVKKFIDEFTPMLRDYDRILHKFKLESKDSSKCNWLNSISAILIPSSIRLS